MNTHVVQPHPSRPRHATGEVVWARVGNYLENVNCDCKPRPAVILRASDCQHWAAALTTQPTFKTTGEARVLVPVHRTCRLCCDSYLWSPRPSRLCRLDVLWHIGWIGRDAVEVIADYMRIPWHVLAELRATAGAMTNTDGEVPAATL